MKYIIKWIILYIIINTSGNRDFLVIAGIIVDKDKFMSGD